MSLIFFCLFVGCLSLASIEVSFSELLVSATPLDLVSTLLLAERSEHESGHAEGVVCAARSCSSGRRCQEATSRDSEGLRTPRPSAAQKNRHRPKQPSDQKSMTFNSVQLGAL